MTYASWSTGFKGAGITPRAYYPQQVVGFGPETLKSYEVGLKSQWLDNRIRSNLALFREDYDGVQASANSPQFCVDKNGNPLPPQYANPCGEYINAANAMGKGAELEVEGRLVDHLMIDASVSYLDLHVTKSLVPGTLPVGSPLGGIGKTKGSAGVQYELPLGAHGSVTPRLDVSYTPGFCNNLACTPILVNAPYTLLNGRLTYWSPGRGWSAALQGTNLTNKLYYITKTSTGIGYVDGQIGQPREWALTLHKQF
jgi:iron complex outermembrane receptor protein